MELCVTFDDKITSTELGISLFVVNLEIKLYGPLPTLL